MANSEILNLPLVAPNQNQKETTINSALAILEAASNDETAFSMASGNRTLNTNDYTRAFHLQFTGQTAARVVTLPTTLRFFAASNNGAYDLTFKTPGSSGTTVIVAAGKRVLLLSDGLNVLAVSSGVSTLANLSDVAGTPSDGQLLRYEADTSNWNPADDIFDPHFFAPGLIQPEQVVFKQRMVRAARLFSDFSGSQGDATAPATDVTTFEVYKNATLAGTIVFAVSATAPTFSTDTGGGASSITLAPGDLLTIVASPYPDAAIADVSVTLKGVYL